MYSYRRLMVVTATLAIASIGRVAWDYRYQTPFQDLSVDKIDGRNEEVAVVCAVIKDDEAYIDEWVDYHHALGFAHFYLFDNSDRFEMKQWGAEKGDHVTVVHFPGANREGAARADCVQRYSFDKQHTWVAFFEVADFLVLKKHLNVLDFLLEYGANGDVEVNLVLFGTAGRRVYSPKPVTKRFMYRESGARGIMKHIIRLTQTESKQQTTSEERNVLSFWSRRRKNYQMSKKEIGFAVIHHYQRSVKEYNAKFAEILTSAPRDAKAHQFELTNGRVFDDTAWKGRNVTMKHYPGSSVQFSAYDDCIKEYAVKNRHTWVAFFDLDEMLYLKDHNHVVDLLSERCQSGSLSFNWIRFGHGEREVYQPLPMTKRFQFRENVTEHRVKAIARVQDLDLAKKITNPHFVNLKSGAHHDVNGKDIVYPLWSNPSLPTNTAVLHHYNTKSYKELIAKRLRGRADTDHFDFLGKVRLAMNREDTKVYPRFSKDGWEATKKFLPLYEQAFD